MAKAGSVTRAAEAIAITPQTLSGQIGLLEESLGTELFAKQGRSLVLTEAGKLALDYADELFALSAELEVMIKHHPRGRPTEFRVGVSDAVPKSLACQLLQPAIGGEQPTRIVCREWQLDRLLGQLAVHQLDLVISDAPIPASYSVRAYNHRLLESGLSFLAAPALLADQIRSGGKISFVGEKAYLQTVVSETTKNPDGSITASSSSMSLGFELDNGKWRVAD